VACVIELLSSQPAVLVAADESWDHLGRTGMWWTGAERIAIANAARAAAPRPLWDRAPDLAGLCCDSGDETVSPFIAGLVERVAVEPSTLRRDDVGAIVAEVGDAAYAELCSVVCQVVAVDHLAAALGNAPRPFPAAAPGEPLRLRPDGMADVGGHIEMTADQFGPNVRRSLSLAGADHERWMQLVMTMYAGEGFVEMVWDNRALTRPQVELMAARTSALNECFY
jgi:hypothetical protein